MNSRWKLFAERLIGVRAISPEQQRRGRLLVQLLIITVSLVFILGLVNLWLWLAAGSTLYRMYFFLDVFALLLFFGIWYLNRSGRTRLAGYLTLAMYFIGICTVSNPERFFNAFWAFLFPIMLAGFILGPVFSFPAAAVSALIYLLFSLFTDSFESIDIIFLKTSGLFGLALFTFLTASHLNTVIKTVNKSEKKYRSLFHDLPIGLYRTSPEGQILDANSAFITMFGFPDPASLQTIRAADLYADPFSRSKYLSIIDQENRHFAEILMRRLDGTTFWVTDHVQPIRDADGKVLYYEGSLIDVTERKLAEQNLERLATTDPLTGLSNRRHFFAQTERVFARANKPPFELALLMIDVDHFKEVNDRCGHAAGDSVLHEVGRRIHENLRNSDLLGRYGGDEFAILLSRTNHPDIEKVAERLCTAIAAQVMRVDKVELPVTISIGVAMLDGTTSTLDLLLQRADQALYIAKQSGRDRWVAWQPSMGNK